MVKRLPTPKSSHKAHQGHGSSSERTLKRPSKTTQKAWPASKLNAFAMPGEQYGWGKLADTLLQARGWKIHRPCTVVHEGKPEDVLVFLD